MQAIFGGRHSVLTIIPHFHPITAFHIKALPWTLLVLSFYAPILPLGG
jgi:hypothetical protein